MVALLMGSCATMPSHKPISDSVEAQRAPIKTGSPTPKAPAQLTSLHHYQILDHKYFVVYYDNQYRLARWVKYELTKDLLLQQKAKRKDPFKADILLGKRNALAVKPAEYKNTGYDKGHLAPSADFAFSQDANNSTFVMSNMVPQKPKLNQIAWKALEEQVRKWACGEERVTVITGPILEGKMAKLPSGLVVPNEFFKIVFDETPPRKAIAFIYRQEDAKDVMKERIVDLKKLDERIHENFSSYLEGEERQPAQSVEWKECTP